MNTLFLLVLLTTNANGMNSVSFVNTESLAQCKAKESMITAIFRAGNIIIDQSQCIASPIRFSKYSHNPSSSSARYFWLVDLSAHSKQLVSVADINRCNQAVKQQSTTRPNLICAVTDQAQID